LKRSQASLSSSTRKRRTLKKPKPSTTILIWLAAESTLSGPKTLSATTLRIRTGRCLVSVEDASVTAPETVVEIGTVIAEIDATIETEIVMVTTRIAVVTETTVVEEEIEAKTSVVVKCRRAVDAEDLDRLVIVADAAALLATIVTAGEEEEILVTVMTLSKIEVIVAAPAEETASIKEEIATTAETAREETIVATKTAMTADAAEERTTVDTIAADLMRADAEAATEAVAKETERTIARSPEEDAMTARRSLTILLNTRKRKSILMKIWLRERSKSSIPMTIKRTKSKRLLLKRRRLARMNRRLRTHLKNNRVTSRSLL